MSRESRPNYTCQKFIGWSSVNYYRFFGWNDKRIREFEKMVKEQGKSIRKELGLKDE